MSRATKRIDPLLWKFGLVRRARYENLNEAYRDVWRWWEQALRARQGH